MLEVWVVVAIDKLNRSSLLYCGPRRDLAVVEMTLITFFGTAIHVSKASKYFAA